MKGLCATSPSPFWRPVEPPTTSGLGGGFPPTSPTLNVVLDSNCIYTSMWLSGTTARSVCSLVKKKNTITKEQRTIVWEERFYIMWQICIFINSGTFRILFHFCQDYFIQASYLVCASRPLQQPGHMLLFFSTEVLHNSSSSNNNRIYWNLLIWRS